MTTYLDEHLGRRIPTKELADWLQLDVDFLRHHYASFGGIRPVPKGKILFFERNVVDALSGACHAVKDHERCHTRWKGRIQKNGQIKQKLFDTKTEALEWEAAERKVDWSQTDTDCSILE